MVIFAAYPVIEFIYMISYVVIGSKKAIDKSEDNLRKCAVKHIWALCKAVSIRYVAYSGTFRHALE